MRLSRTKLLSLAALFVPTLAYAGFEIAEIRISPVPPPFNVGPYPPGTEIDGQLIKLREGGVRVWFNLLFSNWDPSGSGGWENARTVVAMIVPSESFAGASAEPPGPVDLMLASQPCETDLQCRQAFGHSNCFAGPRCLPSGMCEAAFVDPCGDNHILAGVSGECAVDTSAGNIRMGCRADNPGVVDDGTQKYFGTFVVDIPLDARGKYRISLAELYAYTYWCYVSSCCDPAPCFFNPIDAAILIGEDCNDNDVLDELDIDNGTSPDLNENGVPDECEVYPVCLQPGNSCRDCQPNGFPDDYDISSGASSDCNANAIPDDCDARGCFSAGCADCNGNGLLDECDIASGLDSDIDGDAVPDRCEGFIPAVSTWGLAIMALALLIVAKLSPARWKIG